MSVKIMLGTAQPSRHTQRGRVRAQGAGPVSYSLLLLQLKWERSGGEEERGEERTW